MAWGRYGVPLSKSIKANKTNITYFEYVFGNKVYIIVQDPNDLKLFKFAFHLRVLIVAKISLI